MTYKRILVPVDGSRNSQLGLKEAVRLAKGQKASLILVHVVDEHIVVMASMEAAGYFVSSTSEETKSRRNESSTFSNESPAAFP